MVDALPRLGSLCSVERASSAVKSMLPIVDWLGNYKWREDLVGESLSIK